MRRLETARLELRDYGNEDWERVHIYGSSADFSKYKAWGPNTVEDTKKFVDEATIQARDPKKIQIRLLDLPA